MADWLNRPGSLNWANRKKLTQQIHNFEETILSLEVKLQALLEDVYDWKNHATTLMELSSQQQLTAKHILHLRPLLQKSEQFHQVLISLCLDKPNFGLTQEDSDSATY